MQSFHRKLMPFKMILCLQIIISVFVSANAKGDEPGKVYSFVYLGDIHYDKRSHHDFEWVKADKPNDIRQIENYVMITEKYTPSLLRRIQNSIESSDGAIQLIVQGGDLTEGLCGSRELQETQFRDVIECIRSHIPKTTFLSTKGNHDITGPGAKEAFDNIMLPWLSTECKKQIDSASFFVMKGPDLFVFFDAYHNNSLDWLEQTLSRNKHRHAFVVMHPPAVPYNARSTWHLFSRDKERDVRERFMNILGTNNVILLTAHLHKYVVLARKTPGGTFVQFSINSVISSPKISVRDQLEGIEHYGSSLVDLEPEFSPDSIQERKKILEDEKPYITHFEYANFPGYVIINVSDTQISADIYTGYSDKVWKNVRLDSVLKK